MHLAHYTYIATSDRAISDRVTYYVLKVLYPEATECIADTVYRIQEF